MRNPNRGNPLNSSIEELIKVQNIEFKIKSGNSELRKERKKYKT